MEVTRNPQTFPDNRQRLWTIRFDFINLRTIRDGTGIDLGKPTDFGRSWAELLYDDEKALAAIWVAIQPQAEAQHVSQADWLSAMDGGTLEVALEALAEAVVNFTQPQKRGMVEDALEVMQTNWQTAVADARSLIRTAAEQGATRALQQLGIEPSSAQESLVTSTNNGLSVKPLRQ